jgi:hypothetical protein
MCGTGRQSAVNSNYRAPSQAVGKSSQNVSYYRSASSHRSTGRFSLQIVPVPETVRDNRTEAGLLNPT